MVYINENIDIRKSKSDCKYDKHNLRLLNDYKNENIDLSKSHLNQIQVLQERKHNKRLNGVETFNFVLSCQSDNINESNKYLREFLVNFKQKWFPDHKLNYWAIHNDESSPHIHFEISAYNEKTKKWDARTKLTPDFFKKVKEWERQYNEKLIKTQPEKYRQKVKDKELELMREKHKSAKNNIEKMKSLIQKQHKVLNKEQVKINQFKDYVNETNEIREELENNRNIAIQLLNDWNQEVQEIDRTLEELDNLTNIETQLN